MKNRPQIDEYFLKFAMLAAERSTCLRHNVGAVIVKDKHIYLLDTMERQPKLKIAQNLDACVMN